MLLEIANHLVGDLSFLNVFRYITFRTGGAMLTALIVSFIFGPFIIRSLKKRQSFGQPIRSDGPEKHIIEKKRYPYNGRYNDSVGSSDSYIAVVRLYE